MDRGGSIMARKKLLTVYSVAHAAVDFACAFLVYRTMLDAADLGLCLLLYNFCAFALQMPFGLLADGWNRNGIVAAVGCAAVALAYLPLLPSAAAAVIAGVGNGLFHVGGGLDVLNDSKRKSAALGIFVSPGALGLYLGGILGQGTGLPRWSPVLLLAVMAVLILLAVRRTYGGLRSENAPAEAALPKGGLLPVILLTAVVVLRSYMGFNQNLPWKGEGHWGVIVTAALVLGKAAGGFLCDRLGARRAAALSLVLAAVLYLFSGSPVCGTAAVFLFNMTMPITLWAAARLMPGGKGFAFGLLTFALFLGYLPTWMGWSSVFFAPWVNAIGALVSAALLLGGLREERVKC